VVAWTGGRAALGQEGASAEKTSVLVMVGDRVVPCVRAWPVQCSTNAPQGSMASSLAGLTLQGQQPPGR
jgi:hypothetical protein